ncbi:MAG: SPOR domain-containing protein [Thermodesulfobacteriota bacterium]
MDQAPSARTEAAKPAPGSEVITKKTEPTVETSAPPAKGAGDNFTVQIASVDTADGADVLIKKLQGHGFDAYYYVIELNNRRYYRIRVGRYQTRDQARATLDQITAKGYKNAYISNLTD